MTDPDYRYVVLAHRVNSFAHAQDPKFSLDPAAIKIIIDCIIAISRLLYMCYEDANSNTKVYFGPKGRDAVKKPGVIYRALLRRYIYVHCKDFFDQAGRETIYKAMLDVGSGMSNSEITHFIQLGGEKTK